MYFAAMVRLFFLILCVFTVSCGGLDPESLPQTATVSGTVVIVGGRTAWPDSVLEMRVVLFDQKPSAPDSVIAAIVGNKAAYTDTLPRFVDSCTYSIAISKPPHTFTYAVVAGRTGPNLLKDWTMLALHTEESTPSVPATVVVMEGAQVVVDFNVDFAHLPEQPFQ